MPARFSLPREVWKVIPRTDGDYEVSSRGRVRALHPALDGRPLQEDDLLSLHFSDQGYLMVSLFIRSRMEQITAHVHACLLEAFKGEKPSKEHVAVFLDGDTENLDLSNLAWLTPKQRNDLRRQRGTVPERPTRRGVGGKVEYQCNRCERWLPKKGFYPLAKQFSRLGNPTSRCGLNSECKQCDHAQRSERRRIARLNGGRVPTLLEKILPLLRELDGLEVSADDQNAPAPAHRIAKARAVCAISQAEVARRGHLLTQTIERIEKGKNLPRPKTLRKIIDALRGQITSAAQ